MVSPFSDLTVVVESFYKGFLRNFSYKCFQIMVGSRKIVEEIRPDCTNQQWFQIMVNLSEILLGGIMLEVQSRVWV